MIDVGVNIASDTDPMPYFTAPEALLDKLDAVVLTHAHLDHTDAPCAVQVRISWPRVLHASRAI